jgi:hypothetical protein
LGQFVSYIFLCPLILAESAMAKATKCPAPAALEQLAAGQLAPPEAEPLLAHMELCPACLAKAQTLTPNDTLVHSLSLARNSPPARMPRSWTA